MRFLKLLICLLIACQGFAQSDSIYSKRATRYRPGIFWFFTGMRPGKTGKYDRLVIDVTYNQLQKTGGVSQNPARSFGCNLNLMWDTPLTKAKTVSFGIGLAYKYQKTGPKGLFFADGSNSYTHYYADSSYMDYRKNTFGNHILAIPIEFRFRTHGWQHFKVHIGGSVGYRLQTFQKMWPEKKHAIKDKSLPDVNRLVYGVHMRIGIRNWALFADYTLAPQFKSNKSDKISALAFGVSLSLF
ncbi:outer membrane beta-barrel protein [Fluviicola taffensis]|uniref:Outer membrane protein beta-barrel domain-containing protein n=1 Tax=Fluviicola taffensis (strain DSM 16823 / NCIMB 13979 / RW262) TaxID=755732 RepID=F2IJ14_FLUTR|nr:outer membrane beta-barrel protein [Fluviicola taffensis]AEA43872.1 hypothetical protein Fluta_1885 [Fluviicola taffensis DSM 16823]